MNERKNRWLLTEEVREKYKPIISKFLEKMYNATDEEIDMWDSEEFTIDFSDTELRPYTLKVLLEEEFGYTKYEFDNNGWELDFMIDLSKPGCYYNSTAEKLAVYGCGMTFELKLSVREFIY